MSKTLRFAIASGLLGCSLAVTATSARADVPPPEGYVEACTVEKQAPGQECVLCGDSYYKTPNACAAKLEPDGYTKACRTRGASTWKEVWCKKGKAAPAASVGPAPSASAVPVASSEPATPVASAPPAASAAPAADAAGKSLPENAPKRGCGACRVGAPDGATGVFGVGAALGLLGLSWMRRQRRS
jgi:MYXO-CTERM domain-containing protein